MSIKARYLRHTLRFHNAGQVREGKRVAHHTPACNLNAAGVIPLRRWWQTLVQIIGGAYR